MNERFTGPTISRRDFLKLARTVLLTASGIVGLAGLLRYFSFESQPAPQTDFDIGPASNFSPGSRTVLPQIPAVLLHTLSGFIALSLICPHLGCTVETRPDGFACPCHGSKFGPQGQLVHGPAARPMTALRLQSTSDGHLHVYTN